MLLFTQLQASSQRLGFGAGGDTVGHVKVWRSNRAVLSLNHSDIWGIFCLFFVEMICRMAGLCFLLNFNGEQQPIMRNCTQKCPQVTINFNQHGSNLMRESF